MSKVRAVLDDIYNVYDRRKKVMASLNLYSPGGCTLWIVRSSKGNAPYMSEITEGKGPLKEMEERCRSEKEDLLWLFSPADGRFFSPAVRS